MGFKLRATNRARTLRNEAPPAERELWKALANRQLAGHKFSRQMPIESYFADFLCRERRLIVEVDGFSHDLRQEHDIARDHYLRNAGYTVLRFTNADVLGNMEGVVCRISEMLDKLKQAHPRPLPPAGGER